LNTLQRDAPGVVPESSVTMTRSFVCHPIVVAVAITLLNSAKPVAVDDTAYLAFARHIAAHPLDPYGFEMFWSDVPQPALEILAPPVVPYWLGAGNALFGENELFLKFWLFPLALVLTFSLRSLACQFAPGTESTVVPLVALSGVVLPLFGFMLDVPATALGLAALATFAAGGWRNAVIAGSFAGLAIQTKYTAVTIPAAILAYGGFNGIKRHAVLAGSVCSVVFVAWEVGIASRYGHSHFLFHARAEGETDNWLGTKLDLTMPLIRHLGGLAGGLAVWAGLAAGWRRSVVAIVAVVAVVGSMVVVVLPGGPGKTVAQLVFFATGAFFVLTVCGCVYRLRFDDPMTRFLLAWLVIEMLGYFVLTPFPAGRRVMGVAMASAFVFARAVSLSSVRVPMWALAVSPVIGLGLFALDAWDARAERDLARAATAVTRDGGTVWFNGHWGFQHYCERAGMKSVVPDRSVLMPGDWLVFPVIPDDIGFYRPYHGGAKFRPDGRCVKLEFEFVNDDGLSGQTIPTLYGGGFPFLGRKHPRLRIAVYRVTETHVPERLPLE
jgi:hypothetical protein